MDKEFLVLITFDKMPNLVLSAEEDNVNLIVLYRLFYVRFTSFGENQRKDKKNIWVYGMARKEFKFF